MPVKTFKASFYVFVKSATSPSYYKDLLKVGFGFSIKYLLVLALIASTLTAVKVAPPMIESLLSGFDQLEAEVLRAVPDDLVVSVKDGELSINKPQPYIIDGGDGILVIDTEGTIDDLESYDTPVLILVNKANIIAKEENEINIYPLKDMPDMEITKDSLSDLAVRVNKFLVFVPYVLTILIFALALIYYFGIKLLHLLFVAGLIMVIGTARGVKLEFKKFYQICLHAMTLPLIIEVVAAAAGVTIGIPFWFSGLNLLIALAAIIQLEKA